jgi:hypothetical protein
MSSYIKIGVLQDAIYTKMGFEDFIKFVIKTSKILGNAIKKKAIF